MPEDEKPKKKAKASKPFKSIEDILNISNDNLSFNDDVTEHLETKMDKTAEFVKTAKEQIQKIRENMTGDEYSKTILKELVERAFGMLAALQAEVEENPTGRTVETAAAMVTTISNVIDNINKMDVFKRKLDMEERKLQFKEQTRIAGGGGPGEAKGVVFFGDTTSMLDALAKQGILPSCSPKFKDVSAEVKIEDEHDKKDE